MAITYLASRGNNNIGNQGASVLNNPTGISYLASRGRSEDDDKNRGGLIGGIGYLGEKLAVGTVSSIEGISDYTFSGLAKLFGNDAWAEEIIKTDWFGDWYSHPEEWFNPGQGWQVAGDVAGGIGTSLPGMAAAVGLTVATGGVGAGAAASFLVSGLGAAGRGTKEAYEKTGKLTGKEYGYGALVGATEGGVEALGNLIGMGSGAVVKSVTKALGRETAEAFTKQGLIKTLGSSFLGEAFEEGMSEILTPFWQRATYDPNAKNASADEVLYAGLVGGLSGMVMGGGGYVFDSANSFAKGNKLAISGGDTEVLETSGFFSAFEEQNQTGDELFLEIASRRKSLIESMQNTNGKAVTIEQKRELGALSRANIAGATRMFVAKRAQNIVNNADIIAQRLTAYGYKTADGKPITFTAEEITAGYDASKPSSIYKALQTNEKLRSLAVADATGQLMMDTNQFKKNALMGEKLASQVDINRFYENASQEEIKAVSEALKIDSWSSLTAESFNQKIADFVNNGGVQRTLQANERRAAFASLNQEGARPIPKIINMAKDGVRRYSDGQLDIAVERKGDSYTLYNYSTNTLSKELTRKEVNSFLRDYSNRKDEYAAAERAEIEVEERRKNGIAEIDTLARENIKNYASLNAPNQSMIRKVIREGRAKGISDSDLLMYAKISAHSGLDIQFDKEATLRGTKADGSADYADGFYEASKNRIVVNPEGKRTAERLLIHELDHAIRKYFDSEGKPATRIYFDAIEGVAPETREKILQTYKKTAKPGEAAATVMDETNAYYAEQVLSNRNTLEKLIEAEPTLKDKILSFFKGAEADYADVPKLSGAAKKYYRTYKKLFEEFSARNAQSNSSENAHLSTLFEKKAQKMPITNMKQENMHVSGRDYAVEEIYVQQLNKEEIDRYYKTGKTGHVIHKKESVRTLTGSAVLANPTEIESFVNESIKESNNITKGYAVVPKALSDKIADASNNHIIAENWFLELSSDDIYHLYQEHHKAKEIGDLDMEASEVVSLVQKVDGNADVLGIERYKTQTKVKLGIHTDTGDHYIVAELVSSGSQALRLKTAWKVSEEKYNAIKKEEDLNDHNRTNKSPAISDKSTLFDNSISQPTEKSNTSSKNSSENSSGKDFALDIESDSDKISGAEVMGWLKDKPKSDGTLNLEATVARGLPYKSGKSSLTVGEIKKLVANSTREKVYSKADALKVVNRMSGTWGLTQRARDEIADTIWQFLNESPDVEYRQDMAHDIAEYIVAKVLVDSKTENPDAIEAAEKLSYLRTGIGKLSFSDEDIAELRHAADEKGLKRLMGRWGFKGTKQTAGVSGGYVASRRTPMDVFVTDISREMPGMDYLSEMHPAEALLEIDRVYSKAYADSKDKWISQYWDMPDSEIPSMIKGVEDSILEAYESVGEKSRFTKLMEEKISRYEKRAERFKAERDEIKGRDRILGLLMNEATKMKNLKLGTFANATQHESDVLRGSVERLSRLQFRGNLNVSGARNIISELRLWYSRENNILGYKSDQDTGYYVQGVKDMLDALADGEGGFTKADLMMLYDVMAYFNNFVETFGKVYRRGRWIDAEPEAKRYVNLLQSNESIKVGPLRRLIGSKYMQTFGDPMTVARRMDMYESGFYTEMLEELREGAMGAQIAEMEVREEYDKFLTENRKYIEKTASEKVIYQGVNVPKMHLIGVYMTLKRKHSRAGLAQNGFAFDDLDGKRVRVNGFAIDVKDITEAEIDKRSEEQLNIIAEHFNEKDFQYIKILEKAYNVDARKLKADRDMQRLGYTNAGMGYYYPIRRGNIAKNVDSADYMAELDRVSNSSFNKNTVRGARQELFIENADVVFRRHVRAVCQYSYLSPAVETYNRLYNLDVGGNPNHPISVATEGANTWDTGNKYFVKLISDIQGIPAVSGEGAEILAKIRGGYAKYQLGANPKVWFTQLSSFFASSSRLDADSIAKGAGISAEGVDKYCPLAKLRNSENTAAIAQAVLDTRGKKIASGIDRFSDALMAPIGKMDRFVIGRLFGAAQAQIEKEGGGKVGSEENKIAAGKLLTEVILETQQNSIATERSAAMRSGNEIMRTATMFTSDSMKVTGRVIDTLGEALTLKQRLKKESDADVRKMLEERYQRANKRAGKALGAMVGSAVYMACIAQLFRWLYNKDDDEDKSIFETMVFDVIGNMTGGLPFIKDVYTKLFEGYDVGNFTYSAINDLIDSAGDLLDVAGSVFDGEMGAAERNRAVRNLSYSVGQFTGLPTRNVYNVLFGLTKRFSPSMAFVIDGWFYEKNYQSELGRAIEKGDNEMSSFILSLMLGERLDAQIPESVFNEILSLTKAGDKVLPRTMPESITSGGVEYLLSDSEREEMKKVYSGCERAIADLIHSEGYKKMTNADRATAIDYIYDSYYAAALEEVCGIDGGNRTKLLNVIGTDILARYHVSIKGLESDKDREGNSISGSKRKKVIAAINGLGVGLEQRLLLICASGYTLKDGDIRGVSAEGAKNRLLKYILRLRGLTAQEKAEIAEMCGFTVKNGRIVNNFSKKLQKLSAK